MLIWLKAKITFFTIEIVLVEITLVEIAQAAILLFSLERFVFIPKSGSKRSEGKYFGSTIET